MGHLLQRQSGGFDDEAFCLFLLNPGQRIDGASSPCALLWWSLPGLAAVPAGDFPTFGFPPALDTSVPRAGGNGRHFRLDRAWNNLDIVPVHGRGVGG